MPTKKEQTVEKTQKKKPAAKKASAHVAKGAPDQAAKGALGLPTSSEAGDSHSLQTATTTPATTTPAKVPGKKPVKRTTKKTDLGDTASAVSAQGSQAQEHQEVHASAVPEAQEHFHGHSVTEENISVRAYFIGEHRRAYGIPGNSQEDWLEAERQLQAEAIAFLASRRSGVND